MNKKAAWLLSSAAGVLFLHGTVFASETTTYTYDSLGRLVGVSINDGPGNGMAVTSDYDPAGNRENYTVTGAPAFPGFSINNVSATEGGSLTFTVTKSGTATGSLSVSYATANGTAAAGSDYTAASGTLTFAQADTTKTITVVTTDDTAIESSETVLVNLSGATGGWIITVPQGTGTIVDNDTPPSFAISDVSVTEGGSLTFTVTKSGAATGSFSVSYATANGTATSPSDYAAASGTLTFAQAETSKTITVATVNDTTSESNETVFVNLSGATGGSTITDSQGSGTIVDNDAPPPPSFSVNDVSATEGGSLTFTVTKTGVATGSFSVNYATANGTATAPSDYTTASGTLAFAQAETSKTITVSTVNDTATESSETLLVNLSGATGGSTITDSQGGGTILDNDAGNSPPVAVNDTGSTPRCQNKLFNVLANDSDPDGNLPLALVSVSGGGALGTPSISGNQVLFEPEGIPGTATVNYTMRDSLNATASATLTVTITLSTSLCGPME